MSFAACSTGSDEIQWRLLSPHLIPFSSPITSLSNSAIACRSERADRPRINQPCVLEKKGAGHANYNEVSRGQEEGSRWTRTNLEVSGFEAAPELTRLSCAIWQSCEHWAGVNCSVRY